MFSFVFLIDFYVPEFWKSGRINPQKRELHRIDPGFSLFLHTFFHGKEAKIQATPSQDGESDRYGTFFFVVHPPESVYSAILKRRVQREVSEHIPISGYGFEQKMCQIQ